MRLFKKAAQSLKIDDSNIMTEAELLAIDSDAAATEDVSDESIMAAVKDTGDESDDGNEIEPEALPKPTKTEIEAALDTLCRGLETMKNVNEDDTDNFIRRKRTVQQNLNCAAGKQTTLMQFFKKN